MTSKDILFSRKDLEQELERVKAEEAAVDNEIREYFQTLSTPKSIINKRLAFDSADLTNNIKKVEEFSPMLEVITEDSRKLMHQIDECRQLSDRLSVMVRRLDLMQVRAQQALVCTQNVINLKESKVKLLSAIEDRNLPQAVQIIRQVHTISSEAARTSDDYDAILNAENETRILVKEALSNAMEASDIGSVVSLCPLLQTLGLEVEARDNFLSFIESTVFIAVSADVAVSDNVTDVATGYAQALSNVFNSSYLIFQKYLSIVIQGMENSLGDILFIRKLHSKCEKEAGLVLKRYMKYRNIKQIISNIKGSTSTSISTTGGASQSNVISVSELHAILDELALLIQYCCLYAKYLKTLCSGAETRSRALSTTPGDIAAILSPGTTVTTNPLNSSTSTHPKVIVFHGPTEFDKMIDELINKYYMDGEHYLLRSATKSCLPKSIDDVHDFSALDECFFVLQRCGLRAVATNNIHAACAILHLIADLLVSDVSQQARDYITKATNRINSVFNENMARYISKASGSTQDTGSLSIGLKSAMSLASSITGTSGSSAISNGNDELYDNNVGEDDDDPWRVAQYVEAFNALERCTRYTDRLTKDIMTAAEPVFSSASSSNGVSPTATKSKAHSTDSHFSGEMDKIRLCKEDFDASKISFQQVLRQGLEKIVSNSDSMMKEVLQYALGKGGPMGGLRFDLPDERFDEQAALSLLPRAVVTPFETMVNITTFGLSDANKDLIVSMLAETCVERVEHFINQTTFRFAGALKFEECVRAITNIFTRASTGAIRSRFARLREILVVLTSDLTGPGGIATDSFSHLTSHEIEAYLSLRVDSQQSQ